MKHNEISLFIMQGCAVCPQMERIFHEMHQKGAISGLQVIDVDKQPELATQHNIRSVPYYLINGVAFNGLKSRQEITRLLRQNTTQNWLELIREELTGGNLDAAQQIITQNVSAREAMIQLLQDQQTELVVRIGLTAIIETLSSGHFLDPYEEQFIKMTQHKDERIAVDALYYLSLLSTPECLLTLSNIAKSGPKNLRDHACELLDESSAGKVLH